MKEIHFNIPLQSRKYSNNVKSFLNKKLPLHGPGENIFKIKKKLKELLGFKHVHLTNSCTSAMEMSALLIDLKSSDEVILPSYTFVTTGSSFARTGCKLRYCDIQKNNLMPSFNQIKKCVTKKTKAIVIVHYQGFSVDYLDKLKIYCKRKKIFLIEDAAQAFGSYFKNKPLGTFGDFACFSFHNTKNVHAGVGGLIVINNKKFLKKSQFIFDKGTDRTLVISNKRKYYSWVAIGSSFLLPELNASYLLPQFNDLKKIVLHRSMLYKRYIYNFNKWINDEFYICSNLSNKYNFHALVIVLKKKQRVSILNYLKRFKINAFIGYVPLHKSKVGKRFLHKKQKLKITDELEKKIIRLPLHNSLTIKDIDYVSQKINFFFNKY
jgi:dTDP-4-amino-4,6-dideoxygalactose transaminase